MSRYLDPVIRVVAGMLMTVGLAVYQRSYRHYWAAHQRIMRRLRQRYNDMPPFR